MSAEPVRLRGGPRCQLPVRRSDGCRRCSCCCVSPPAAQCCEARSRTTAAARRGGGSGDAGRWKDPYGAGAALRRPDLPALRPVRGCRARSRPGGHVSGARARAVVMAGRGFVRPVPAIREPAAGVRDPVQPRCLERLDHGALRPRGGVGRPAGRVVRRFRGGAEQDPRGPPRRQAAPIDEPAGLRGACAATSMKHPSANAFPPGAH